MVWGTYTYLNCTKLKFSILTLIERFVTNFDVTFGFLVKFPIRYQTGSDSVNSFRNYADENFKLPLLNSFLISNANPFRISNIIKDYILFNPFKYLIMQKIIKTAILVNF